MAKEATIIYFTYDLAVVVAVKQPIDVELMINGIHKWVQLHVVKFLIAFNSAPPSSSPG